MAAKIILLICCIFRIELPEKVSGYFFPKPLIQATSEELQIFSPHEVASYNGLIKGFYESFFLPPIQNAYMFHDCAGYYDYTFYFKVHCKLSRSYKEHLVKLASQSMYDALVIAPYIMEADILYEIQNTLDDATRKTALMARRRALNRLIDLLGENYFSGKVPPPVPISRFKLGVDVDFGEAATK